MNLSLTPEESQTLANLLDLAVKAGGMQAALAAVPLFAKLQKAVQDAAKSEQPTLRAVKDVRNGD